MVEVAFVLDARLTKGCRVCVGSGLGLGWVCERWLYYWRCFIVGSGQHKVSVESIVHKPIDSLRHPKLSCHMTCLAKSF